MLEILNANGQIYENRAIEYLRKVKPGGTSDQEDAVTADDGNELSLPTGEEEKASDDSDDGEQILWHFYCYLRECQVPPKLDLELWKRARKKGFLFLHCRPYIL